MKKKAILCILLLILIIVIVSVIFVIKSSYKTYVLGDYGVEITAPTSFVSLKRNNASHLLNLYNKEKITISVTELRGDFWESNDIEEITSEYASLIFTSYFDSNISNVEKTTISIQGEKLGKITMKLQRPQYEDYKGTLGLVAVLIPKSHGYLAIEIYGDIEWIENNASLINSIVNSIKFTENKHDYSKDIKKGLTLEQTKEETEKFFENYFSVVSGESLINQ